MANIKAFLFVKKSTKTFLGIFGILSNRIYFCMFWDKFMESEIFITPTLPYFNCI